MQEHRVVPPRHARDHALVHLLEAEPVFRLGQHPNDPLEGFEPRRVNFERLFEELGAPVEGGYEPPDWG